MSGMCRVQQAAGAGCEVAAGRDDDGFWVKQKEGAGCIGPVTAAVHAQLHEVACFATYGAWRLRRDV